MLPTVIYVQTSTIIGGRPSKKEKEMQKLLEDKRAARQLLQEQIMALQKAQAATPAVKKSVAPSISVLFDPR